MSIKFTNNATSTLASSINNSVTSLSVASGQGALFPTLSGSDVFYVTLSNVSGTVEIVKVTARSTDTFTIVRAQDNTTAAAWNSGDRIELRPTALTMAAMAQIANNLSDLASASTARTNLGLGTAATMTGPSGTIVGTTDSQTLTNKTITSVAAYETKVAVSASAIDVATGNYFSKTISTTTTFTINNTPTTGIACSFILDLTNGGSSTVNWWSGVKWAGGTAPTLTSAGRDVLGFFTHDGGTTWTGLVLGKDVK
jgi:hypothetical protein